MININRRRLLRSTVVGATLGWFAGCMEAEDNQDTAASDGTAPTENEGEGDDRTETEDSTTDEKDRGSWPFAQYDPANTGHTTEATGPAEAPEIAWHYETDNSVMSSPVVHDTTVYAAVTDHATAINIDGEEVWTSKERNGKALGAPAYASETVVVGYGDDEGIVMAYDATDGTVQWKNEIGQVASTPVINEEIVYVPTLNGKVAALSLSDGSTIWTESTEQNTISPPAVRNETLYVGEQHSLYAFDASDGSKRWQTETNPSNVGQVVATEEYVFTAGTLDTGFGVAGHDAASGELLWEKGVESPGIAWDGERVLVTGEPRREDDSPFMGLAPTDGTVDWKLSADEELGGSPDGPPTVADGTAFLSYGGRVVALATETGTIQWMTEDTVDIFNGGSPNVVGETLYLTTKADIVALA